MSFASPDNEGRFHSGTVLPLITLCQPCLGGGRVRSLPPGVMMGRVSSEPCPEMLHGVSCWLSLTWSHRFLQAWLGFHTGPRLVPATPSPAPAGLSTSSTASCFTIMFQQNSPDGFKLESLVTARGSNAGDGPHRTPVRNKAFLLSPTWAPRSPLSCQEQAPPSPLRARWALLCPAVGPPRVPLALVQLVCSDLLPSLDFGDYRGTLNSHGSGIGKWTDQASTREQRGSWLWGAPGCCRRGPPQRSGGGG